jgi:hypothetical protein
MAMKNPIKVPLTIDVNYLPNWGIAEGTRELVQNWLDASDDLGINGVIKYNKASGVLQLHNPGATLSRNALLLGNTSKASRDDQRGQFGEGLKLGSLALVREGCSVVVRTNTETWKAKIEESSDFAGERVLTWHVFESGRQDGVTVTISPIGNERYAELRKMFTHFQDMGRTFDVRNGTILLSPEFKGKIFAKGIFISHDEELEYGYNFKDINVDRDRKMISSWELNSATSDSWYWAMDEKKVIPIQIVNMLAKGCKDVRQAAHWNANIVKQLGDAWSKKYPNTVPTESDEEVSTLMHFGSVGRNVGNDLYRVLIRSPKIESPTEVKRKLGRAPKKIYRMNDLLTNEADNLLWAVEQLQLVLTDQSILDRIRVVDFYSESLGGIYRETVIDISYSYLDDRHQLLAILVHEFAHDHGIDGDKRHVQAIENTWMALAKKWIPS